MTTTVGPSPASAPELGTQRRALTFLLPSSLFLAVPLIFAWPPDLANQIGLVLASLATLFFFLGSAWVEHRSTRVRWGWLLGLAASITMMDVVTVGDARAIYFTAYLTAVAALLLDWRQARWVISVASLAAGTYLITTGDMIGSVMAVAAFAIGWSVGSGRETDRMRAALQAAEERTAVLAVVAERERISRDLHDILGHSLTAITVKADLARRLIQKGDGRAEQEVTELGQVARQALADVRATASGMREVRLSTELASARSVLEAAGVECQTPSALPLLTDQQSEIFGYVLREAVTNVVRHAQATLCRITVDGGRLTISDDGRGLPPKAERRGLAGLAERLEAFGGSLAVQSGPNGTTLTAELPAADQEKTQ